MLVNTTNNFFSALSDPNRVRITEIVADHGQMSAGDISHNFEISFPAISQHLKVLREAEILLMEKQAQKRLYAINPETFREVASWIDQIKQTWEARFDQLDHILVSLEKGSDE